MLEELSNIRKMIEMFTGNSIVPYSEVRVEIPQDAKTVLFTDFNKDLTAAAKLNDNIVFRSIIPDIKDVSVSGNSIVVTFYDDTSEKAVLSKNDTFNLEQGISVCITKKLLSMKCPNGAGLYNKIIKRAVNLYNEKLLNEKKAVENERKIAERQEKRHIKNEQRKIRRENDERERQIEIQKEAYLRAMREYNEGLKAKE